MELQEIEVFIAPDGTVRLEVRGVKGEGCLGLTEALEKGLGGGIVQREMTSEAHEEPRDPAGEGAGNSDVGHR